MKQYKVITITHKTTSLNKLGKFVIPDDDKAFRNAKLDELKSKFHLSELLYLATCNRVCYFFYSEEKLDSDFIVRFFQFLNPLLSESELYHAAEVSRTFEGADAIQHLFEIASSLDSLVIGERQILNQLRTSYEVSKEAGLTGDNIRLAMKAAIPVAKSVYTHTGIGEKPVSVVSLAVQKLLETDVSQDSRFLMIGAGQTNNLVMKFLLKHGFSNIKVFNRSLEKAEKLALKAKGEFASLDDLNRMKERFDVIISCTGAGEPVLSNENYTLILNGDRARKTIIDLAIPNDISYEIVEKHNVNYIDIETLRSIAENNLEHRRKELGKAKEIVSAKLEEFQSTWQRRQIEKALGKIPLQVKSIRENAVSDVFSKDISRLDDESREVLDKVLNYMEKKYISLPISTAKEVLVN